MVKHQTKQPTVSKKILDFLQALLSEKQMFRCHLLLCRYLRLKVKVHVHVLLARLYKSTGTAIAVTRASTSALVKSFG